MKKIILHASIGVLAFFATWFVLNQIDWMKVFKVQKVTDSTEQKLGDLFWEYFSQSEEEVKNKLLVHSLDSLVNQVCKANQLDRKTIKVHILNKDEINAFALPNGHLIVYTGLIQKSENQEALCGVLCHEIAHIQLKHVMKKLGTELGLSVLISMTSGNVGSDAIKKTAKVLSSSAFDRGLEKEADIKAVDYLANANINTEPFANFLNNMSLDDDEKNEYLDWVSTHPDSKERAEYILEYSKTKTINSEAILSHSTWRKLKAELLELKD